MKGLTMHRLWTCLTLLLLLPLVRPAFAQDGKEENLTGLAADAELVETRTEVPRLKAPAAYVMKDNTLLVELSEYAGYAGLIVANGGLEPTEDSIFFRQFGFKVQLVLSEEESWSALNSGRMGVSATTVDVLAVYGKQFQVVVPGMIGYSRGADGIVVTNSIKRINDLKGKTLATAQFTEADFFIRYLAQEAALPINMLADLATKPDRDALNLIYCADAFAAGDLFLKDVQGNRGRLAGCVTWAPKTTEVAEESGGKAKVLATNRNLLIVADILIVNKGFAAASPDVVTGLVHGMLEGNRQVRDTPQEHWALIAKAFAWSLEDTKSELSKVHLANYPENRAFFAGTIDSAGSFGGIYESAVYSYGSGLIPNPVDSERFQEMRHLDAIGAGGTFKDQKPSVTPLRSGNTPAVEGDPLLSKDIRFLFRPNSSDLDLAVEENIKNLESIRKLLQVSPGSTVLLRGHVDNALVETFRKQGGESFVRSQALKAMELSKARAGEIARLLGERYKVEASRIERIGRGWEEPLGDDSEQNRRVEVQWFTLE